MENLGRFAVSFMGVDRWIKDDDRGKGSLRSSWFQELYKRSNFSFLGMHLTHPPLKEDPGEPEAKSTPRRRRPHYTPASTKSWAHWVDSCATLSQQGWGGCWFYVGYSPGWNEDVHSPERGKTDKGNWPTESARQAGLNHGRHIKVAIADLLMVYGSDNTGSVVYVDNEGGPDGELWNKPDYVAYYHALFEEMRRPGPSAVQPVRPGFYGPDLIDDEGEVRTNISELLDANPDLFVWQIDHRRHKAREIRKDESGRSIMRALPEESSDGRLWLDPKGFDIYAQKTQKITSSNTIVSIPVGIQGFLNYEDKAPPARTRRFPSMPSKRSRAFGRIFVPINSWDFNMSFVRDPRFPEASPRVRSSGSTIAQGRYERKSKRMRVTISHASSSLAVEGAFVEPDAPLLLPCEDELITLDETGTFVLATAAGSPKTWPGLRRLTDIAVKPTLRRARAAVAMKLPDSSLHLLYIAHDLSVQALSRTSSHSSWQGPVAILEVQGSLSDVHPFSNLSCTISAGDNRSIELVTVSAAGHLQTAKFTPALEANGRHFVKVSPIESQKVDVGGSQYPFVLQGSSILAVTPHPLTNLVFVVSRLLRLVIFTRKTAETTWSTGKPLGIVGQDQVSGRVFAHTRLAARIVNPTVVQVACISYTGDPTIYVVSYSAKSSKWDLAPLPIVISRDHNPVSFPGALAQPETGEQGEKNSTPKRRRMALRAGEKEAGQWSTNPYGDICFGLDPSGTRQPVLICAGPGPNNAAGLMYRRFGMANEDWYLRE